MLGSCQEATRGAKKDVARAVSGFSSCCDIHGVADGKASRRDQLLRPSKAFGIEGPGGSPVAQRSSDEPEPEGENEDEDHLSIHVHVASAKGLPKADVLGTADPYVEVQLLGPADPTEKKKAPGKKNKTKTKNDQEAKTLATAKTQVIRDTLAPSWGETFVFDMPNGDVVGEVSLAFQVFDYDLVTNDDCLGEVTVSVLEVLTSSKRLSAGWQALLRQTPAARDRLAVLCDERLAAGSPVAYSIQAIPGETHAYDLTKAELFVHVNVVAKKSKARSLEATIELQTRQRFRLERPGPDLLLGNVDLGGVGAGRHQLEEELARVVVDGSALECRRLLNRGAMVNSRCSTGPFVGYAPLHIACLKGHRDLAMAFVDVFNASIVQLGPGGRSAAMCACEAGDEDLAEWLVSEGVPADLKDDAGCTVLFYSAGKALPRLTAWLLTKQRLEPNERAKDGSTPLLHALLGGPSAQVEAVARQLVDAKASADIADKRGRTPLHAACQAGDDKMVKFFLSTGNLCLGALDAQGQTPALLARRAGMPDSTVKKLMRFGEPTSPTSRNQLLDETMEEAAKRDLREKKADLSEWDWRTWRAMHPRRGPSPGVRGQDHGAGVSILSPGQGSAREVIPDVHVPDFSFLPSSRSHEVPNFIGTGGGTLRGEDDKPSTAGVAKKPISLSRLKSWATGLRQKKQAAAPQEEDDAWMNLDFESISERAQRR